ncbi:MAG TPA: hypothetical protein VFE47_14010 [Tepidisphaeraceae bacterium]|jgi:hypothetical protein|nr:hypothetical protein [Tepidisphaeraceae bacterium]
MRSAYTFLSCVLLALFVSQVRAGEKPELWLYYPTNLLVDQNLDKAKEIWGRAAAAGYDHVLIADSKFSRLPSMDKRYFQNCDKAKKIAEGLKLQLVPALFSVGYSNDILSQDPNLAEGLPVKDQLFIVKNGTAEPAGSIHFGKMAFHDDSVSVDGNTATVHAGKSSARFTFKLPVTPFRCYHISVKIKTADLHSRPEIKALAGERGLQWQNLQVKPTQDWTQCDVVFNSLDNAEVNVYFGIWDEVRGSLQWKDWSIEEVGLVNVLRRPGAPCIVKEESTGKVLKEGTDFEPIVDPRLGNNPFAGEYDSYHTPAAIHTKLPDGTKLLVSWYHPAIVYDGQVSACISEPKFQQLLADQARRMKEIWGAPLYMMSHDEFRTCNFDEACESKKQTPGELLAANVRECTKLLRPQKAAVWNDMFDPYHNAVKGPYYLVNGPYTNSWEGLDKDVLVVNWNHGKRDQSLKFFADRGNRQLIAGYYDNDLSEFSQWLASAKKVNGVVGYMYTTWRGDYSAIEKFAKMARE